MRFSGNEEGQVAEGVTAGRKFGAKEYFVYYLGYTLLFGVTAAAVFVWFWLRKKRFVWQTDGVNQHYYGLLYFSRWGKEVLRQFRETGVLQVPTFSLRMGFGEDLYTTLAYYVIGDPFSLPAVFVPERYLLHFHDLMLMARFYLAGITFSAYAFYMGRRSRPGVLAGALVYIFNGFTMSGMRHHYFLNPFVFFPLMLIACERYFRKRKPGLYIFMVFLTAVSNFYFFYMIVLMTVLYAVWRSVRMNGLRHFGRVILDGIAFLWNGLVGVLLSAFLFLPIVLRFMQDPRAADEKSVSLLWPLRYYRNFLDCFLTNGTAALSESWTYMGFGAVAALCVVFIFVQRKKHFDLKAAFVGLTCLLMTPVAGYVLNGFSYPANRWMFAYALLVGYMTATALPEMAEAGSGTLAAAAVVLAVAAGVCVFWEYTLSRDSAQALVIALFGFAAVLLGRIALLENQPGMAAEEEYAANGAANAVPFRNAANGVVNDTANGAADDAAFRNAANRAANGASQDASQNAADSAFFRSAEVSSEASSVKRRILVRVQAVVLACVVLTIAAFGYFDYAPSRSAKVFEYLSRAQIETQTAKDSAAASELIDGNLLKSDYEAAEKSGAPKPFYRYTTYNPENNTSLLYGVSNTQYYWSLSNPYVAQFLRETGQLNRMIHLYDTLDNRTALNAVAGIRYFLGNDKEGTPFGYEKKEGLSYSNAHLWPENTGLERYACEVYENRYALPIGFTSDRWISRAEYDALDIPQKQEALLQAILVDDVPADAQAASFFAAQRPSMVFDDVRLPVTFSLEEGKVTAEGLTEIPVAEAAAPAQTVTQAAPSASAQAEATAPAAPAQTAAAALLQEENAAAAPSAETLKTGSSAEAASVQDAAAEAAAGMSAQMSAEPGKSFSFNVFEGGAAVEILFDGQADCETGLYIRGLHYTPPAGRAGSTKFLLPVTGYTKSGQVCSKQLGFTTPQDPWTTGQSEYLVNMMYHAEPLERIEIRFPAEGTFSFDSAEVVCQPMTAYQTEVQALRESGLTNLDIHEMGESFGTERITGQIDLDQARLLCIQIPWSAGWSAYVDGERAELLRADTAFCGLLLPAGSHNIELRYQTPGLRLGAAVSAVTLLLLLLFCIIYAIVSAILGGIGRRRAAVPEGSYTEDGGDTP